MGVRGFGGGGGVMGGNSFCTLSCGHFSYVATSALPYYLKLAPRRLLQKGANFGGAVNFFQLIFNPAPF